MDEYNKELKRFQIALMCYGIAQVSLSVAFAIYIIHNWK